MIHDSGPVVPKCDGHYYTCKTTLARLLCTVPAPAKNAWVVKHSFNSSPLNVAQIKKLSEMGYQPMDKSKIAQAERGSLSQKKGPEA